MIEFYFFDYAKAPGLDASSYADFLQALQTTFDTSHFWQMIPGTISSKLCMTWYRPWRTLLLCRRNRHAKLRGSYIERVIERMSFFVIRLSLKLILNILYHFQHPWYWKVLKIFNSIVRLPVKLLSPSGIWNITSFLILMIFISLNRPLLHRSAGFWIRIRALLSDDTDFSTTSA